MDGTSTTANAIDRSAPEHAELKKKLVSAFHIIARRKMDDGIAGHISCRVPGTHDQFWVNPLGLFFEEITEGDLLVVDLHGNILEGKLPYNRAAFAIHATLHARRRDVVSICHTHPPKGTAFSGLGRLLKMLDQNACAFYEDQALFSEYDGIVATLDQAGAMADAIGDKRVAILQNHGLITLGQSIEQAVVDMLDLERTCEINLALLPAWGEAIEVPREAALQARSIFTNAIRVQLQWNALVRQVERQRR